MKFDLKDMYRYLLSHTFPGFLLGIEVILAMYWFTDLPVELFIVKTSKLHPSITIIIGYAISTLFGFILDGIHHFLFEDIIESKLAKSLLVKSKLSLFGNIFHYIFPIKIQSEAAKHKYIALNNENRLEMYTRFVEDDYYYPYETYANMSIVIYLGFVLLLILFFIGQSCNVIMTKSIFFMLKMAIPILLVTFFVMLYEAIITNRTYENEEVQFCSAYMKSEEENE